MTFWVTAGVMTLSALAFVLVPIARFGMRRRELLLSGGLAVAIPLVAGLVYHKLGTPAAATQPLMAQPMQGNAMSAGGPDKAWMSMDLGQLADKLAEKLKKQPGNAEGRALLARTYVELKRYGESLPVFEQAVSMLPGEPALLADYADARVMSNGGRFDRKSAELIEQALKLDPAHVKSLMLKATMAFNGKDYPAAIAAWEKILSTPGLDTETASESKARIKEAHRMMTAGK